MSIQDIDIQPHELVQAAAAAVADARGRGFRGAAQVLADAGLCGVCADPAVGGLGLGLAHAVPLVSEAGRLRLHWPLLENILIARALGAQPGSAELAAQLVGGERLATWALQGDLAEGWAGHARFAQGCDWVLVADGTQGAALLDLASVAIEIDEALDPDHPQYWLHFEQAQVLARIDASAFAELQRDGEVLVAAWVNGAAEGALRATAEHLSTRVQFGRPLSAKQAVRHSLARMRLLQEATRSGIERVLHTDEWGQRRATRPILATTLSQAAWVLEKSIHLHGGMGFTWELPLHHALREVRKFDAAYGAGVLAQQVGRDFIASV